MDRLYGHSERFVQRGFDSSNEHAIIHARNAVLLTGEDCFAIYAILHKGATSCHPERM